MDMVVNENKKQKKNLLWLTIYKWIQSHEEEVAFERSKKLIIAIIILVMYTIQHFE